MSQISKQVANRLDWARFVLSSYRVHREEMAEDVEARITDSSVLTAGRLLEDLDELVAGLERQTDTMRTSELELSAELADDHRVRADRDTFFEKLRDGLTRTRTFFADEFDDTVADSYGMQDAPPRTPDKLVPYAQNVVAHLRREPRAGVDAIGLSYDTDQMADRLDGWSTELEDALDRIDIEIREVELLRAERDKVVEEWEQRYLGTAKLLEGLYILAGRPDLAKRVRPTKRRSRGVDTPRSS
jgi:hypothetical protein